MISRRMPGAAVEISVDIFTIPPSGLWSTVYVFNGPTLFRRRQSVPLRKWWSLRGFTWIHQTVRRHAVRVRLWGFLPSQKFSIGAYSEQLRRGY